jgi:Tfp pilus assembly protein PilF
MKTGKVSEGLDHVLEARRLGLNSAELHQSLAFGYSESNQTGLAIEQCRQALAIDPSYAPTENLLGVLYCRQRNYRDAVSSWRSAAEHDSTYGAPHINLASIYIAMGQYADAWQEVHLAQRSGAQPSQRLLSTLSARMPEPR